MEHFDMNIYEREARKSILMDEGWESRFLDRQECCKYLEQYFDEKRSMEISEEIRKGKLRHNISLQNFLAEICGNEMMENMRAIRYLPSKDSVIENLNNILNK